MCSNSNSFLSDFTLSACFLIPVFLCSIDTHEPPNIQVHASVRMNRLEHFPSDLCKIHSLSPHSGLDPPNPITETFQNYFKLQFSFSISLPHFFFSSMGWSSTDILCIPFICILSTFPPVECIFHRHRVFSMFVWCFIPSAKDI